MRAYSTGINQDYRSVHSHLSPHVVTQHTAFIFHPFPVCIQYKCTQCTPSFFVAPNNHLLRGEREKKDTCVANQRTQKPTPPTVLHVLPLFSIDAHSRKHVLVLHLSYFFACYAVYHETFPYFLHMPHICICICNECKGKSIVFA